VNKKKEQHTIEVFFDLYLQPYLLFLSLQKKFLPENKVFFFFFLNNEIYINPHPWYKTYQGGKSRNQIQQTAPTVAASHRPTREAKTQCNRAKKKTSNKKRRKHKSTNQTTAPPPKQIKTLPPIKHKPDDLLPIETNSGIPNPFIV
jgi:hypothetical protein